LLDRSPLPRLEHGGEWNVLCDDRISGHLRLSMLQSSDLRVTVHDAFFLLELECVVTSNCPGHDDRIFGQTWM
jgi:hypothetical protein